MDIYASYQDCLSAIFSLDPNPKWGLSRTIELLNRLELAQPAKKVVQIVGTNGKGSTTAFLDSILVANGLTTGRFTSPHLSSARERVSVSGELISPEDFVDAATKVLLTVRSMSEKPSFFECMLALALCHFKKCGVDVVLLEAGLGGRFDATTAVTKDILGVTAIDLDHQHILGETLTLIAKEKLAAAHEGLPVFSMAQKSEVMDAIKEMASTIGYNPVFTEPLSIDLPLLGEHQKHNAGLALKLAQSLQIDLDHKRSLNGLRTASWPGRFEVFHQDNVDIILDGAHNVAGMAALALTLTQYSEQQKPIVLVYGAVDGHDTGAIVKVLYEQLGHRVCQVMTYVSRNKRSRSHENLAGIFLALGVNPQTVSPFSDLLSAKALAAKQGALLLVTGSLYMLGEIRPQLIDMPTDGVVPLY